MDAREAVWQQAKSDLTIRTKDGHLDVALWEHAERVAHSALAIVELSGVGIRQADREILVAAALYQSAAWVVQYQEGSISLIDILAKPLTMLQRELGAGKVEQSLQGLMSSRRLESVCRVIREAGARRTSNVAAQVVAEATNLDQIGPLALCQLIRRHMHEGRGVQAIMETWNRQQEYNFWPARIRESFRLAPVKKIAEQRLEAMERFMNSLGSHMRAEDLKNAISQIQSRTAPHR